MPQSDHDDDCCDDGRTDVRQVGSVFPHSVAGHDSHRNAERHQNSKPTKQSYGESGSESHFTKFLLSHAMCLHQVLSTTLVDWNPDTKASDVPYRPEVQ